jgi:8-oxo-dGTP pyrophosphatase MutT (NUDIX family)
LSFQVIDADGFRPNVGIVLSNAAGQLLWAKRIGQQAWQFPQGGIQRGEKPEQALFRELNEELGLNPGDVQILGVTSGWLRYRLPQRYLRRSRGRVCIGQKQKWFALRLKASETAIRFDACDKRLALGRLLAAARRSRRFQTGSLFRGVARAGAAAVGRARRFRAGRFRRSLSGGEVVPGTRVLHS